MNKNNIIENVTITAYGTDGGGIARIDGCVVFVASAAAGDICDIRIVSVKKTHMFAIIETLHTPSPDRVPNNCPYYPRCGGCDTRHISYAAELALKRRRVADALQRIGGADVTLAGIAGEGVVGGGTPADAPSATLYVPEVLPSRKICGYRNKAVFQADGAAVGLNRRRSHDVVDVVRCRLQADGAGVFCDAYRVAAAEYGLSDSRWLFYRENCIGAASAAVVAQTRALLRTGFGDHIKRACPHITELSLIVNDSDSNVVMQGERHVIYGKPLVDTLCGFEFEISQFSFYQINREQAEKLYETAIAFAQLDGSETVLDLYCGIGTLTLALAAHSRRVVGAEVVAEAVRDAEANAQRNNIDNVSYLRADAGDAALRGGEYDVVVLDPPRKGVAPDAIAAIAAIAPRRIVYVSCDVATLARDIALFRGHGYALDAVQPVDMFPRTMHIECVARLDRI